MEFNFNTHFEQMMEKNHLQSVVILGHMNPDGDAAGSVMGLAHYIHAVYPQYRVFPYLAETLDKGPKKLVVKDQVFCPFEKPDNDKMGTEEYGVIVCDTATRARIIGYDLYEKAAATLVIDHHASDEGYGDVNYTKISEACAENIYGMLDWEKWKKSEEAVKKSCSPNAADYVYLGIVHDTACFERAKETTFQAVLGLLGMGVNHRAIVRTMHAQTLDDLEKQAMLLHMSKRAVDGKVVYVCVNQEEIRKYGIGYEDIHPIGGILRNCDDIEMGFTMYEEEPDVWRCSFRSDGKWIDVNQLLLPFGGGGHAGASGLRKKIDDSEKLRNEILQKIEEMRAGKNA
ncbi:MAG: DHH family phosphoesterase [Blautia sp.]|nr:DHH family phosphoesterase [Blautia sp.]MDY3998625.1 DHH family phosphoesterase [Blautia sp.]